MLRRADRSIDRSLCAAAAACCNELPLLTSSPAGPYRTGVVRPHLSAPRATPYIQCTPSAAQHSLSGTVASWNSGTDAQRSVSASSAFNPRPPRPTPNFVRGCLSLVRGLCRHRAASPRPIATCHPRCCSGSGRCRLGRRRSDSSSRRASGPSPASRVQPPPSRQTSTLSWPPRHLPPLLLLAHTKTSRLSLPYPPAQPVPPHLLSSLPDRPRPVQSLRPQRGLSHKAALGPQHQQRPARAMRRPPCLSCISSSPPPTSPACRPPPPRDTSYGHCDTRRPTRTYRSQRRSRSDSATPAARCSCPA